MLEKADPSFQDVFYPKALRCPLSDERTVRAIEENWPAYFPARKECRGPRWSLTIPENEPLYKPHPKSLQKLEQWKKDIKGTIVEIRAYRADTSWRRFVVICRKIPRLRLLLGDFETLTGFLINEESMWPSYGGGLVSQENFFNAQMRVLFSQNSPYRYADRERLRFLRSKKLPVEKICMINLIQKLFDRPLMLLAVLQKCASESAHARFWLPIQGHITAIIGNPSPTTFRKTWLEHTMQISGAIKKNGKSSPRKWAQMLVPEKDADLNMINAKAVEVHGWLKGKKQPSMKNIVRAGQVVFARAKWNPKQVEAEADLWLFSWMITLWLEKHFMEIASEFKEDDRRIKRYYRRFFQYLKIDGLTRYG